MYANHISKKEYPNNYLQKAKIEIPFISKLLNDELIKDGRLGACVDVSIVLSRILEKEGYWNYITKGSLTIEFPKVYKIDTKYFWSSDIGDFVSGHSWVVCPPFVVLDLTLKQQPYKNGEHVLLPNYICSSEFSECEIDEIDLISLDMSLMMKTEGILSNRLNYIRPNYVDFTKTFKPKLIKQEGLSFKYVTIGIAAPDEPLERVKTLKLNQKLGIEIYNEIIKPKLKELRS